MLKHYASVVALFNEFAKQISKYPMIYFKTTQNFSLKHKKPINNIWIYVCI